MVSKNNTVKTFISENIVLIITLIFLTLLTFSALFIALEKHKVAKAYETRHTKKISEEEKNPKLNNVIAKEPSKNSPNATKNAVKNNAKINEKTEVKTKEHNVNTASKHLEDNVDKLCFYELATLTPETMFVRHSPKIIGNTSFLIENDPNEFKVSGFFNKNVTKDMLHVAIEEGFLIVKVKQKEQKKTTKNELMSNFVSLTIMQKVILIPDTADILKTKVVYENNILKVVIPKITKKLKT